MLNFIKKHAGQFSLYVLSGGVAAIADYGGYLVMIYLGVWYVAASVLSGIAGFCAAFLMHKYVVFKKNDAFMKHLFRYFIVDMLNTAVGTMILFALVEQVGMGEEIAKFISMGMVVFWNFFIYKFFVYV